MRAFWNVMGVCVVATLIWYFGHFGETLRSSHWSPDGRYVVEVYRVPWSTFWATPGSGSDAPVVVYLKTKEGEVVERWTDLMVQTAGPVEWGVEGVEVGPHAHWWVPVPK